jgi:alkylhydroperoxidase/carboxymuconolactone decarboxylase family protein YurZ
MNANTPVLDTLTEMTTASVERNSLPPRDFMLARLAALIAVDAPPISYFANASAIQQSGMTTEDIEGVMIAIAPVVGAPRVMSAGGHILRALGIAVAVAESEMADEESLH